nr:radical SAM protein [bacterium]
MIFSKLLFLKQLIKYKIFNIQKPLYAYWFITDRCNLKCSHCFGLFHTNSHKDLSESETDILLKEIISSGIKRITLLGGEPLLNPYIDKITETLYKNNISILILTNGTYIERHKNIIDKIDEFGLSLDGCETTHNKIRGKDNFKEVMNSIDFIKKYGKKIVITYTLLKSNLNDI